MFFSKKNKVQSCLNQKEINTLNRYRRAKLTFFFFFFNLKRLQRDNEVFKRAMSKPIFSDSSEASSFCRPHFNSPHPGHLVGFLSFYSTKVIVQMLVLLICQLILNKKALHIICIQGPMRVFFSPFLFFLFFPRLPFLFCFCSVWGGGGKLGFLSPLNTLGHGNAVL